MEQTIEKRTVREFVEDMISDGKTDNEVVCVALSTHWSKVMNEVKEAVFRLRRRMAKRKKKKVVS